MIRVYYTHAEVENISPALLETWIESGLEQLPKPKRDQILRLRPPLSRFNSTFGWLLVKFGFRHSGYADFELSRLNFDERQKPRWPGAQHDFNLSHSGSLLACVLTDNGQVGIDVEQIRPLQDQDGMFERILAPQETLSADAGPALFFQYWTRKEAVIKAEGNSGVWDMPEVHLQETEAYYKNRCWQTYPLELVPGYAACTASDRANPDIRIEAVTCEQLINGKA
jgi:4'-phosphopantetheinyl transferase